jgi:hypothetical protein
VEVFRKLPLLLLLFILVSTKHSLCQIKLSGHVYDKYGATPLTAVSVLSTSGSGTFTDSTGHYEIIVSPADSIWFSYLGKATHKFSASDCGSLPEFTVSLFTAIPVLKEVIIKPRNYKTDSIQNRMDYAKAFNFKRPTLASIVKSVSITGIVIDLYELARLFQFRKNNSWSSFRDRLVEEEKNRFIDHRFTKYLVRSITGIAENRLEEFMTMYRPSYSLTLIAADYDFREYIKRSYQEFLHFQEK